MVPSSWGKFEENKSKQTNKGWRSKDDMCLPTPSGPLNYCEEKLAKISHQSESEKGHDIQLWMHTWIMCRYWDNESNESWYWMAGLQQKWSKHFQKQIFREITFHSSNISNKIWLKQNVGLHMFVLHRILEPNKAVRELLSKPSWVVGIETNHIAFKSYTKYAITYFTSSHSSFYVKPHQK